MSINFDESVVCRWTHWGIDCAVAPNSFGALNGYIKLPKPIRWLTPRGANYENLPFSVHGGLTYGMDEHGWTGFDTVHSGDVWPKSVLKYYKPEKKNGDYDPCKIARQREPDRRTMWTPAKVRRETEQLARQVWNPMNWVRIVAGRLARRLTRFSRAW